VAKTVVKPIKISFTLTETGAVKKPNAIKNKTSIPIQTRKKPKLAHRTAKDFLNILNKIYHDDCDQYGDKKNRGNTQSAQPGKMLIIITRPFQTSPLIEVKLAHYKSPFLVNKWIYSFK
jgi:hypothetical protein